MLVYSGQAAFDATVQTLEAHYARTDNVACTDNSLEISHLSVQNDLQFYADNNTEQMQQAGQVATYFVSGFRKRSN